MQYELAHSYYTGVNEVRFGIVSFQSSNEIRRALFIGVAWDRSQIEQWWRSRWPGVTSYSSQTAQWTGRLWSTKEARQSQSSIKRNRPWLQASASIPSLSWCPWQSALSYFESSLVSGFVQEIRVENLLSITTQRKVVGGVMTDFIRDRNFNKSYSALRSLERKNKDVLFVWTDYKISAEKSKKLGIEKITDIQYPSWFVIFKKQSYFLPPDFILTEQVAIDFVRDISGLDRKLLK